MSKYLRKFETEAAYSAETIYTPSVSLIASNMSVKFDPYIPPTPTFSGLTVYYNITDTSSPTQLFYAAGGSGSGSGSGSGGVLPSAMIIDGTEVEVTNAYQFSTTGEHIVNYSFEDNQIPDNFLYGGTEHIFNNVVKVEIGDAITSIDFDAFVECYGLTSVAIGNGVTSIGIYAFSNCSGLTSCTIGSGVTSIGSDAFWNCTSLTSITSNAMAAPEITYTTFASIGNNGTLTVPSGSQNYCDWISSGYLPSNWIIEGVTCGSGSGSGS